MLVCLTLFTQTLRFICQILFSKMRITFPWFHMVGKRANNPIIMVGKCIFDLNKVDLYRLGGQIITPALVFTLLK